MSSISDDSDSSKDVTGVLTFASKGSPTTVTLRGVPATSGQLSQCRARRVVAGLCCDDRMVTVEDVRRIAADLPGSYEVVVRDRVKFRVGRYVYLAFSHDETVMGFAYLREERDALVASDPETFLPPDRADERYQWVQARMAALDLEQLRELVVDAWRIAAPKRLIAQYANSRPGD
jgi:hypothetical protein